MFEKRFLFSGLFFFFVALFLSSCSSKQQVTLPPNFKGPKELGRIYGMRITPDDNIYLYNAGAHWIGTPHRLGGMNRRGVDCSGFVNILYQDIYGIKLARSSAEMLKKNCRKVSRGKLREGDLVFFQTGRGKKKTPNHVGIYLKNGRFIHVSTSRGVMVSSLSEPYYMRTWITGGRVK
ncbi:NlpC/P60 family protein [Massilibacteroides sp.]|uniref:C40 family peptidase n=1 Tax=Massilibacteroides sp. TaxID=2034766 RepID=UPI0026149DD8|nr:NlpC/P60 family protein [Massilibacteroides sp.]MDD4514490.1 NlpC/P60 family protein [Massilibacteroides sp.]